MITLPALHTNGEKVGTCTFIEPKDYLHFDRDVVGPDFDVVKAMVDAQMAGEVEDGLDGPRLGSLRLFYEMLENKLELANPIWWAANPTPVKGAILADMSLALVPKWVLADPAMRDRVVLFPVEEIHQVVTLLSFGDNKKRRNIMNWEHFWRRK